MADEKRQSARTIKKNAELCQMFIKEEVKARWRKVNKILKKAEVDRSVEEKKLLEHSSDLTRKIMLRNKNRQLAKDRQQEYEDDYEDIVEKCDMLAEAIAQAKSVVIYTGAGISTAASIPDYRGPNGVWTLLQQGKMVKALDLSDAEPTYTHMAMAKLYQEKKVHHVVSQNCDGLHVRSGLPRHILSELHGNMYLEICTKCNPQREYMRLFDVTEKTGVRRHKTGRHCHRCGAELRDTIVHFGEKSPNKDSPYNWEEAADAAEDADLLICLGSSLKVLRKYSCPWHTHVPSSQRPKMFIINLMWTPKDEAATVKINGKCDDVMKIIMDKLNMTVPTYNMCNDPIFKLATPLKLNESSTTSKKTLCKQELPSVSPKTELPELKPSFPRDRIKPEIVKESDANVTVKSETSFKMEVSQSDVKLNLLDSDKWCQDLAAKAKAELELSRSLTSSNILNNCHSEKVSSVVNVSNQVYNSVQQVSANNGNLITQTERQALLSMQASTMPFVASSPIFPTFSTATSAVVPVSKLHSSTASYVPNQLDQIINNVQQSKLLGTTSNSPVLQANHHLTREHANVEAVISSPRKRPAMDVEVGDAKRMTKKCRTIKQLLERPVLHNDKSLPAQGLHQIFEQNNVRYATNLGPQQHIAQSKTAGRELAMSLSHEQKITSPMINNQNSLITSVINMLDLLQATNGSRQTPSSSNPLEGVHCNVDSETLQTAVNLLKLQAQAPVQPAADTHNKGSHQDIALPETYMNEELLVTKFFQKLPADSSTIAKQPSISKPYIYNNSLSSANCNRPVQQQPYTSVREQRVEMNQVSQITPQNSYRLPINGSALSSSHAGKDFSQVLRAQLLPRSLVTVPPTSVIHPTIGSNGVDIRCALQQRAPLYANASNSNFIVESVKPSIGVTSIPQLHIPPTQMKNIHSAVCSNILESQMPHIEQSPLCKVNGVNINPNETEMNAANILIPHIYERLQENYIDSKSDGGNIGIEGTNIKRVNPSLATHPATVPFNPISEESSGSAPGWFGKGLNLKKKRKRPR